MPQRCVVYGCSNISGDGVRLHKFPFKDVDLCKRWTEFVQNTRADFPEATPTSVLCSEHFDASCFLNVIKAKLGFCKYPNLKRGSIPTIHPHISDSLIRERSKTKSEVVTVNEHTKGRKQPQRNRGMCENVIRKMPEATMKSQENCSMYINLENVKLNEAAAEVLDTNLQLPATQVHSVTPKVAKDVVKTEESKPSCKELQKNLITTAATEDIKINTPSDMSDGIYQGRSGPSVDKPIVKPEITEHADVSSIKKEIFRDILADSEKGVLQSVITQPVSNEYRISLNKSPERIIMKKERDFPAELGNTGRCTLYDNTGQTFTNISSLSVVHDTNPSNSKRLWQTMIDDADSYHDYHVYTGTDVAPRITHVRLPKKLTVEQIEYLVNKLGLTAGSPENILANSIASRQQTLDHGSVSCVPNAPNSEVKTNISWKDEILQESAITDVAVESAFLSHSSDGRCVYGEPNAKIANSASEKQQSNSTSTLCENKKSTDGSFSQSVEQTVGTKSATLQKGVSDEPSASGVDNSTAEICNSESQISNQIHRTECDNSSSKTHSQNSDSDIVKCQQEEFEGDRNNFESEPFDTNLQLECFDQGNSNITTKVVKQPNSKPQHAQKRCLKNGRKPGRKPKQAKVEERDQTSDVPVATDKTMKTINKSATDRAVVQSSEEELVSSSEEDPNERITSDEEWLPQDEFITPQNTRKSRRGKTHELSDDSSDEDMVMDLTCNVCQLHHNEIVCPVAEITHTVENRDVSEKFMFMKTLPSCLLLGMVDDDDEEEIGVFAKTQLSASTRFGPMTGEFVMYKDISEDSNTQHLWIIDEKYNGETQCLSTEDVNKANWMKYIRWDHSGNDYNLLEYIHEKEVYFVTTKDIKPGRELKLKAEEKLTVPLSMISIWKTKCIACNIDFKRNVFYRRHCYLIHYGRKSMYRYFCNMCSEVFMSQSALRAHAKLEHSGMGLLACKNYRCQKLFISQESRLKHEKTAHILKKKYGCKLCKYGCSTQERLESHLQWHAKVYKCGECGKEFKRRSGLQSHKYVHIGLHERKGCYCDKCGKQFSDLANLKIHMLTHSGVKPFQCIEEGCTTAYTTKQCLQIHYRKAHKYEDHNMPEISRSVPFTMEACTGEDIG